MRGGKSCALAALFKGDQRIAIPDLQRDYCWGDTHLTDGKTTLAENFAKSLVEMGKFGDAEAAAQGIVSLGLIYAYERPTGFVNIADGQQRLTSIYLLLCVAFRKLRDQGKAANRLRSFLVLESVREPRLQFEIRESTRYFLDSFLWHAIVDESAQGIELCVSALAEAVWFRTSYWNDPSVKSMLRAIEAFWELNLPPESWTCLVEFLLGSESGGIRFVYFDVENREFGEQLYVIINSRGAPMEQSEHIKPLILGGRNVEKSDRHLWARRWEEWQDFFWLHKKVKELSAEEGFELFLTWHVQLQTGAEKPNVYKYFNDVSHIAPIQELRKLEALFTQLQILTDEYLKEEAFLGLFKQLAGSLFHALRDMKGEDALVVALPLLAVMVKWPGQKCGHYHFLRRLRKNCFDGRKGLYLHRNANHVRGSEILGMINESANLIDLLRLDTTRLRDRAPKLSGVMPWFCVEEQIKDMLFSETDRHTWDPATERDLWRWEDYPDFAGDISPLLQAFQIAEARERGITERLMDEGELLEFFREHKGGKTVSSLAEIFRNYYNLERGLKSGEEDVVEASETLSAGAGRRQNRYLLFQTLSGRFPIGPASQVRNWGEHGKHAIQFASRTLGHFAVPECLSILSAADPVPAMESYIRHYFAKRWETVPPTEQTLTLWILFKVLLADDEPVFLIDSIGARLTMAQNRLLELPEANLCNLYCGVPMKKNFYYQWPALEGTRSLNSPLCCLSGIIDEMWLRNGLKEELNIETRQRLVDRLRNGDAVLRQALREFLGSSCRELIEGFANHLQEGLQPAARGTGPTH